MVKLPNKLDFGLCSYLNTYKNKQSCEEIVKSPNSPINGKL